MVEIWLAEAYCNGVQKSVSKVVAVAETLPVKRDGVDFLDTMYVFNVLRFQYKVHVRPSFAVYVTSLLF